MSGGFAVPVRLGIDRDGTDVWANLADSWHMAAQGVTRSGKSVLTYVLLSQVAPNPAVLVTGCDPTGVLLGPWEGHPGSDLRALTTVDMQAHARVIGDLVAEMDRRITSLLDRRTDKLDVFTRDEPLLLVVLEEFPGLLAAAAADDAAEGRKPAERAAPRIKAGVRRLIQEGAKVGIRVLMLAQRMEADTVGGAERSNLGLRVTLREDNADSVRMLHPDVNPAWVALVHDAPAGHGLIEMPGMPLRLWKSDFLGYGDYCDRVTVGRAMKRNRG